MSSLVGAPSQRDQNSKKHNAATVVGNKAARKSPSGLIDCSSNVSFSIEKPAGLQDFFEAAMSAASCSLLYRIHCLHSCSAVR